MLGHPFPVFLKPAHTAKCSLYLQGNVGWDSGFSSKIGRIPARSGWLDNLHRHPTFYEGTKLLKLSSCLKTAFVS